MSGQEATAGVLQRQRQRIQLQVKLQVGKENLGQEWKPEKKWDLTDGTYHEGSAWRYAEPIDWDKFADRFYKDLVVVPEHLEPGEYVLGWRWDAMTSPQVWVSYANIEIVDA